MRIVIAGGGTAGHVYPGLALGGVLRTGGHDVSFLGTERGVEARLVPAAGFAFQVLRARPLPRKLSVAMLQASAVALGAVRECRLFVRDADAVVGMGGYVSVPAVLAARRERVPAVLHEQNAVPGLANRALARLGDPRLVAVSFAESVRVFPRRSRAVVTGNPVREEILRVPSEREALANEGRRQLDLDESRRTIVIFGGSQGALHLDQASVGACRLLGDRTDLQVVLIAGTAHLDVIRRGLPGVRDGVPLRAGGPEGILVRLVGYLERMELAYATADLIVSRAGATTIAEASVCSLPALLVPYPYATAGHQQANARAMQRAGGASVLLDDQLSAETLAGRLESLIGHEERLQAMRERSGGFGRPDAAVRLADLVAEAARRR